MLKQAKRRNKLLADMLSIVFTFGMGIMLGYVLAHIYPCWKYMYNCGGIVKTRDDIPVKLMESEAHRKPDWMSDELAKALIDTNVKLRGAQKTKGFQQGGIIKEEE